MKTAIAWFAAVGGIVYIACYALAQPSPTGINSQLTCDDVDDLKNIVEINETIAEYEHATIQKPENRELKMVLACLYHRKGKLLFLENDVVDSSVIHNINTAFNIREALILATNTPERELVKRQALLLYNQSVFLEKRSAFGEAKISVEKAIALFDQIQEPLVSTIARHYGEVLEKIGDFHQAIKAYDFAMQLATKEGDVEEIVNAGISKSTSLNYIGKPTEAEAVLMLVKPRLTDLSADIKADIEYVFYENLANSFDYRKRHRDAQKIYLQALDYCKESIDRQIICKHLLGRSYWLGGQFGKAKKELNQVLQIAQKPDNKAAALDILGEVALSEKDTEKALQYFLTAQDTLLGGNATRYKEGMLGNVTPKSDFFNMLLDEGRACAMMPGKEKDALHAFTLADNMLFFMRQEHTAEASKLEWRKKTKSMYETALALCLKTKDFAGAVYFMEKSKSVLLRDALNNLNASKILGPKRIETEHTLQLSLHNARQAWQSNPATEQIQALTLAQKNLDNFVASMQQQFPEYTRLKYQNQVVTLPEIQQKLPNENVLLMQFFWGDAQVYTLKVRKNMPPVLDTIPNPEALQGEILAFTELSSGKVAMNESQYIKLGQTLYQKLLGPGLIDGASPVKTLVLIPDGPLWRMPWDALIPDLQFQWNDRSEWGNTPWLLYKLQTQTAYSTSTLWQAPSLTNKATIALVAPIEFKNGLSPLLGSEQLQEHLYQLFSQYEYEPFVREKASKNTLFDKIQNATVVHFHAHAEEDSIQAPKLYLYEDSLTMEDFYLLKSNSDLFFLGSCKSNAGTYYSGEGVFSLSRAISIAGAPSVVSSLWKVPDLATVRIAEMFYDTLKTGASKLEALHHAKKRYILENKGAAHPKNWAAWTFSGRDNTLPFQQKTPWFFYAVSAIGSLLALWFGWRLWQRRK